MAEAHSIELRIRVVAAYESGAGSYPEVAARFDVGEASVKRWVHLQRREGDVAPTPKADGMPSRITLADLEGALDAGEAEVSARISFGDAISPCKSRDDGFRRWCAATRLPRCTYQLAALAELPSRGHTVVAPRPSA